MLGYDFEIIYKTGEQNVVVDALSRKDEYFIQKHKKLHKH